MLPSALMQHLQAWGLIPAASIEALGNRRGCYLLVMRIPAITIAVGALGPLTFQAGLYGYVGSARGRSTTLRHRLARHIRMHKRPHWHIDYLTTHRSIEPVAAYVPAGITPTEIDLAQRCTKRFPVVHRFGNSDMRRKTRGHLFLLHPDSQRDAHRPCRTPSSSNGTVKRRTIGGS